MSTNIRAILYYRVSTKLQEKKFSLAAQETELTRYANQQEWEIVATFQDTDSGGKLDKAGLNALLDCVEEGKADVVLVIDQDRLSRLDTMSWEYLKGILRENKVKIAEPGMITDLANEDDEFISDIKNLIAKREKRAIVRKMMRGKRQFTREGNVWGVQPEEYTYDKTTKILSINEDRAWIIPFIDHLYITEGASTKEIARRLNLRTSTARGKKWTENQVLKKLKNPCYHGILKKTFSTGETITVPDTYPKLRSLEEFEVIQDIIAGKRNRKNADPHILRSVDIRCASCGNVISVHKISQSNDEDNYTLKHTYELTRELCEVKPYVNTRKIEKSFIKAVKDILKSEDIAKQYIDPSNYDNSQISELELSIKQHKKQAADIHLKKDRLLEVYLSGRWSIEKLDEEGAKLDKELEAIEKSLERDKNKISLLKANKLNYETVVSFLSAVANFDTWLSLERQQQSIGMMFPTATLDVENDVLILNSLLPQGVMLPINIPIQSTEEMVEERLLEKSKVRYDSCQEYLNEHPATTLYRLSEIMHSNVSTLESDQKRFGKFKNVALAKGSNALRTERLKLLRSTLKKHPTASGRQLEDLTGINRKMIYKLIKEEGLME
ncbi:recombinase family protein [Lysinibacillus sp. NPDC093688]|uniref:recombinase family protein n=1 Tax=Lysinibacillus sp. NPDC093688 TaxID=3390577 RepID=UPI003D086334